MTITSILKITEKVDLMTDGGKSIYETINDLKKNTDLMKQIKSIAEKGNSDGGDAEKANAEIIELLLNSGVTTDDDSSTEKKRES